MKRSYILATLALFGLAPAGLACSCFGPQTFCGTLDPQPPEFPEPQWWVPSDIIIAVKLSSVQYGADMKVVQAFSGNLQTDQVIRVWGDCGLLCRHYVDGVADGDTVLWALQHCDLSGNGSCGTSFEQEGDYQLSICGVYWLDYDDGIVTGPLTTEGAQESLSLAEFQTFVDGCFSTGMAERQGPDPLTVHASGAAPWITFAADGPVYLEVFDASGRACLRRSWNGSPLTFDGLRPGLYVLQVTSQGQRWTRRLVRGREGS